MYRDYQEQFSPERQQPWNSWETCEQNRKRKKWNTLKCKRSLFRNLKCRENPSAFYLIPDSCSKIQWNGKSFGKKIRRLSLSFLMEFPEYIIEILVFCLGSSLPAVLKLHVKNPQTKMAATEALHRSPTSYSHSPSYSKRSMWYNDN